MGAALGLASGQAASRDVHPGPVALLSPTRVPAGLGPPTHRAGGLPCFREHLVHLWGTQRPATSTHLRPRPRCPPQVRVSASCPAASRSQSTALQLRGAVTWGQVQSKQGPQHAAGYGRPAVSTAPGARPPGDSGPSRPRRGRPLMEPPCDTLWWHSRTEARGPMMHCCGRVPEAPSRA